MRIWTESTGTFVTWTGALNGVSHTIVSQHTCSCFCKSFQNLRVPFTDLRLWLGHWIVSTFTSDITINDCQTGTVFRTCTFDASLEKNEKSHRNVFFFFSPPSEYSSLLHTGLRVLRDFGFDLTRRNAVKHFPSYLIYLRLEPHEIQIWGFSAWVLFLWLLFMSTTCAGKDYMNNFQLVRINFYKSRLFEYN